MCEEAERLVYVHHDPFVVLMFLVIKSREAEHSRVHFRIGVDAEKSSKKPTWNKFYL